MNRNCPNKMVVTSWISSFLHHNLRCCLVQGNLKTLEPPKILKLPKFASSCFNLDSTLIEISQDPPKQSLFLNHNAISCILLLRHWLPFWVVSLFSSNMPTQTVIFFNFYSAWFLRRRVWVTKPTRPSAPERGLCIISLIHSRVSVKSNKFCTNIL